VSVTPDPISDLLIFTAVSENRDDAARLATAYARGYIAYRRQVDTASLVQAETQVETRMHQLEQEGGRGSAIYADLASKDQQLKTLQVLRGSNAFLARAAQGAAQIQPRPRRNGVLGSVLGFMLGVGLVFVLDVANTRVRNPAEIESRLGLPLLGRLPEPARKLRRRGALALVEQPNAPAADTYRVLATNLEFVNLDRGAKTIMFSSATRDEGKSTTVANLAVALARLGRRVVLVDLDLRLPTIHDFFEIHQNDGLTTVALGHRSLDDALVRVPLRSESESEFLPSVGGSPRGALEVLTTGPLPPNPAEFAASTAIPDILQRLTERADIVLVDAAPLLQASESVALTAKVDGLVVVTKLSTMRRSTLTELSRTLEGLPVITLGIVATGTTPDESYGYGYGYGYGSGSYQANGTPARATKDRVPEQGLR
jgi:succinoglycan biosynthesis transport protein ExoP